MNVIVTIRRIWYPSVDCAAALCSTYVITQWRHFSTKDSGTCRNDSSGICVYMNPVEFHIFFFVLSRRMITTKMDCDDVTTWAEIEFLFLTYIGDVNKEGKYLCVELF